MGNTIITNNGLAYVTSAADPGILIAIKHWVPCYDYRIDPDIRSNTISLSAISAVANEAVTLSSPIGEMLWNYGTSAYNLSDTTNKVYVLSGSADVTGSNYVISPIQYAGPVPINIRNGVPLSNCYGGSSVTQNINSWTFSPTMSAIVGVNPDQSTDRSKMYPVIDFVPVRSGTQLRGNFSCRFNQQVGTLKFNKIILYASVYVNGVEQTGIAPGYFAEAYLNQPVKKSYIGNGFSEITLDCQVQLSATGSLDPANIFYGTSADYMNKVPNGFHLGEKLSIGNFDNDNAEPQAVVHIGRIKDVSGNFDEDIHQLKLEYDNTQFISIQIPGERTDVTNTPVTGTTTQIVSYYSSGSDIEIFPFVYNNNWTNYMNYVGDAIAIKPSIRSSMILGTQDKPFRELWLENGSIDSTTGVGASQSYNWRTLNTIPLQVKNAFNYGINVNNNVFIGQSANSTYGNSSQVGLNQYGQPYYRTYDRFGIRLLGLGIELTETSNNFGAFKGGDLFRYNKELFVYTNVASFTATPKSVYILAGYASNADHNTIKNNIDNGLVFTTASNLMNYGSKIILGAKEVTINGSIIGKNITAQLNNSFYFSTDSTSKNLFIGAAFGSIVDMNGNAASIINSCLFNKQSIRSNINIDLDSSIFLVANKIFVDSDIVPLRLTTSIPQPTNEEYYDIGNPNNRFRLGYFGAIHVGDTRNDDNTGNGKGITIRRLVEGEDKEEAIEYGIVSLGTGVEPYRTRWQIGQLGDPVNWGFFNNIKVNNLYNVQNIGVEQSLTSNNIYANQIVLKNKQLGNWISHYYYFNTTEYSYDDVFNYGSTINSIIGFHGQGNSPCPRIADYDWTGKKFKFTDNNTNYIGINYTYINDVIIIRGHCLNFGNTGLPNVHPASLDWGWTGGLGQWPEILMIPLEDDNNSVTYGTYTISMTNLFNGEMQYKYVGNGMIISERDQQTLNIYVMRSYINTNTGRPYLAIIPANGNGQTLAKGILQFTAII